MAALALSVAVVVACEPSPARLAVVTGKVVSGKMAIEGAALVVQVFEGGAWADFTRSRSGYHGTFRLDLPAGRYRVRAEATLPVPGGRQCAGLSSEFAVVPGQRIDRLVVPLLPLDALTP